MTTPPAPAVADVTRTVVRLIAATLGSAATDISPGSHLVDDLGMDSLNAAELIVDIEDTFEIEFGLEALEELTELSTVGDLVSSVRRRLEGADPPGV
jgi:acyl carrier protein